MEKGAEEDNGVSELCQRPVAGIVVVDEDVDKEKKGILEVFVGKMVYQNHEEAVIAFRG
jgi:hypothetical protein